VQENCNKTAIKQICGFCFIAAVRTTATRCSTIAERPRCRVRYSFPQK